MIKYIKQHKALFIALFYILILALAIYVYVFTNELFSIPLAYMLFYFMSFSLFTVIWKIIYEHVNETNGKNKKLEKVIISLIFSFFSLLFIFGIVTCFFEMMQGAKHVTLYGVNVISEKYVDADGDEQHHYYLVGYTSSDEKMTIEINKNIEQIKKYIKTKESEKFEVYYYDLPNYLYKIE